MSYARRLIESEIAEKLSASGALLLKGPKACGKTETARQFAKSSIHLDTDAQVPVMMTIDPGLLLAGNTPRLLDEWQEQPQLWNFVRREVDIRKLKGQFILTGSANPEESIGMHSGAGRFTVVEMQTMSWQELGHASGAVSLAKLLEGAKVDFRKEVLDLDTTLDRMVKGGWPGLRNESVKQAALLNRAYIDLLAEVDMSRVSQVRRDPQKVRSLLRSLARNLATQVDNVTLERDIQKKEDAVLSRPTVIDYLDALARLMVFEEQPAFNTHIRSANALRKSPKRHFCDVSLAIAALKLSKKQLLSDLKYCGFLFESLVYHDLKCYARANDAEVYHYRDSTALEVDAIVQQSGGAWAAFEIKLGMGMVDAAAANLLRFREVIDPAKTAAPASLNIITGGNMSYTRPDGINVISLASLGV
ncbi:MAG: ATP-binding protein [Sphingobacteriaceae bacterium]|nr:ATP-binding protein [Sphingobacteriaceae bacterium]